MNKFDQFFEKNFKYIVIVFLLILFFRTCDRGVNADFKKINTKIDEISVKIGDLPTKTDLQIEGLKTEKRMIQSTDRKMLDVNRQSEIDEEIKRLEKK